MKLNAPNYSPLKVVVKSADGPTVKDIDNKEYIDCVSSYSAVN